MDREAVKASLREYEAKSDLLYNKQSPLSYDLRQYKSLAPRDFLQSSDN